MHEVVGNLWSYLPDAEVRVITTNGEVNKYGHAIMGRGVAEEAARQFKDLPRELGKFLRNRGNQVAVWSPKWFGTDYILVTLPTKNKWRDDSDSYLIFQNVCTLVDLADINNWKSIVMPRPGCGAGNLNWEKEVKPMIEGLLDDRFYVVSLT